MSRGQNLQEMEVGTAQSKTAVNANAKAGMPMDTSVAGSVEDLGGPTPDNYKPDNDSAKLREPKVATVKDVVNRGAKAAMAPETSATPVSVPEEVEETQEVIAEEEVETSAEYDIEEDMNALFSGEELTEEFQEKAKTIFEAAISAKVAQVAQEMEAKNEERIVEEIETVKSALIERVDSYLEYVADEWLQENELAVEHGLKSEMTESFLSGMKELFEAHYVSIPEDKYDVVKSMVNKLDEMETKLNEQIERNVSLNHRLAESVADGIVSEVAEGLALSQKEKLAQLAESVEFESETSYRGPRRSRRNSRSYC
jgi:Mg/Co/Ni transporter MgtE